MGLRAACIPPARTPGVHWVGGLGDLLDRVSPAPSAAPVCPWHLEDVSRMDVGQIQLGPFPSPPRRPALGLSSEGRRGGGGCPSGTSPSHPASAGRKAADHRGVSLAPHPLCHLCCRNSRSPSRSWSSPRHAAVRMVCSTPVRRSRLFRRTQGRGRRRGCMGTSQECVHGREGWEVAWRAAFGDGQQGCGDLWKMYFHSQGRSRTPGSSWTPSQERSRPLSPQRPGMVCAHQVPCCTSAVPVSQPCSPFIRLVPGAACWAVTSCRALIPRVRHHHVRHQVARAALERHLLRLLGTAL